MSELSAGNAKLVQYLNEAYGNEVRLENALQAHISMTVERQVQAAAEGAPDRNQTTRPRSQATHQAPRWYRPRRHDARARHRQRRRGCPDRRGREGRRARPGPPARRAWHGRGREAAQERQDRVRQRGRRDRHLLGDRDARRAARRHRHPPARAFGPPRGGTHAELPRARDQDADQGRCAGGDPLGRTSHFEAQTPGPESEQHAPAEDTGIAGIQQFARPQRLGPEQDSRQSERTGTLDEWRA